MSEEVPLSLGQLSVWHDIRELPARRWHEPNNAAAWRLPPGVSPARVRTAVRTLAARHPSLRTRYDLHDADTPRQLPPDADLDEDLTALEGADADSLALAAGLAAEPFHLERQLPWRARLLTRDGAPSHLLFVKHHIAADAWAQELLHQEFRQELTAPRGPVPAAPGPAELAAEQYGPAGLRRQAAALDHWTHTLTQAPPPHCRAPPPPPAGPSRPPCTPPPPAPPHTSSPNAPGCRSPASCWPPTSAAWPAPAAPTPCWSS
ncbi:condensation domain-containing protein [Streptomyces lydicus]|nr:condensation domain-containing protein [Streptomyces lydicus]